MPSSLQAGRRPSPRPTPHRRRGTSRGCSGPASTRCCRARRVHQLLAQMVARFDGEAAAAGLTPQAAQPLGLTPSQLVTVASIAEKEGELPQRYSARWPGSSTTGWPSMTPRHDSTVLYALGQDGGTVTRPTRRSTAPTTPTCTPGSPRRPSASPPRPPWPPRCHPRRARGSTSPWCPRSGTTRSPTPTQSSWPTRSWPRAGGSAMAAAAASVRRLALGRDHGGRGDRGPGRPLALAAPPQHRLRRPRPRLGVGRLPGPGRCGAGAVAGIRPWAWPACR